MMGGTALIPTLLKKDEEAAQKYCRTFQHATRRVQYVCEHSKVNI